MSLSRRARRGIAIFRKIQWSPTRAIYNLSPNKMIDLEAKPKLPPLNPEVAAAATEAVEILIRNGEKANAELQVLCDPKNRAVTVNEEGRPLSDIPVQQNDNEKA